MNEKQYQEVSIYLDDSGVFSLNSGHNYFIYAGYLFLNNHERIAAREQFKTMSRDYLVQASDILANRLWCGRNFNRPKLYTNIPYHSDIFLP